MLIRLGLAAGAAVAIVAGAPAMAQDYSPTGFYGALGYTGLHATGAHDFGVGGITGRLGTRFSPFFGVEAEVAKGVKDGRNFGQKAELKHQYAGYGVAYLPIMQNADLFARVGYGKTKYGIGPTKISGESLNYGVGAQYFFSGKDAVRLDYTRFDRSGSRLPSSNTWGAAYVRRF